MPGVVAPDAVSFSVSSGVGVIARIAGELFVRSVPGVVAPDACAASRGLRYPTQSGRIRKEILGSSRLPGVERQRGQQHARKALVS